MTTTPTYTPPDDTTVPRITDTRGWKGRREHGLDVFLAPNGIEYVEAGDRERCDLIREFERPGLSPMRLRVKSESYAFEKAERDAAREERVARKRAEARR